MTIAHLYPAPSTAKMRGMASPCFETRIFLLADQLRERKGFSEPEFAQKAWGEHGYRKYARHKNKAQRKGGARLSINDALGLALALGLDLSDLIGKAEREARLDNQPIQPFYANRAGPKGGQKAKDE